MSHPHSSGTDARQAATTGESVMYVKDNYRIEGLKSGVQYCAVLAATTTALTAPAIAKLPPGFRFTMDNSNGSGTMTVTHDGGATTTATAGVVNDCIVTAAGTLLTGSYS